MYIWHSKEPGLEGNCCAANPSYKQLQNPERSSSIHFVSRFWPTMQGTLLGLIRTSCNAGSCFTSSGSQERWSVPVTLCEPALTQQRQFWLRSPAISPGGPPAAAALPQCHSSPRQDPPPDLACSQSCQPPCQSARRACYLRAAVAPPVARNSPTQYL